MLWKKGVLFVGMLGFSDINHVGPLRKCRSWTFIKEIPFCPGLVCTLRLCWKGQPAERVFRNHLHQWLTNYSLQAKSSLPPVFANKILLEHSHAHLCAYSFHATRAELSSFDKDHMVSKAQNISLFGFLQEKFTDHIKSRGLQAILIMDSS